MNQIVKCEHCGKPMSLFPIVVGVGTGSGAKPIYMHPRCIVARRKQATIVQSADKTTPGR